jgi:hypothetical protein
LATSNEAIVTILEDQATVVNESVWTSKLNSEAVLKIASDLDELKRAITHIKAQQYDDFLELTTTISAMIRADTIFSDIEKVLNWLDQYVDNLSLALATLALNRAPPQLLPSQQ